MLRKRRTRLSALVASAIALGLIMAQPAGAVGETPATVVGVGSDAMYRMGQALANLYDGSPGCNIIQSPQTNFLYQCQADDASTITTENYTHDEVYSSYPLGGGAGVKQLTNQGSSSYRHADYALQTSAPTSATATGLQYVAYARDGLTWEAFPTLTGAPSKKLKNKTGACATSTGFCLTHDQIHHIFIDCTITNWNQLPGVTTNHAIAIYTATLGAGTRTQWDAFLGGDSSTCIGGDAAYKAAHQPPETSNPIIKANGDAKWAISLASYGGWNSKVKPYPDHSKLGAVDGVFPTQTSLVDGSFLYARYVFNVYCVGTLGDGSCANGAGPSSAAAVRYVGETDGWICKPVGEHAIEPFSALNYRQLIANTIVAQGFVPLPSGPTGSGAIGNSYCRLFNKSSLP
jgi:ABC-type phosphate transport system substrate-binding protein